MHIDPYFVDLINFAYKLHQKERAATLKSIEAVWILETQKIALCLGMQAKDFAARIGLTLSQYRKRAMVGRLFRHLPAFYDAFEKGDVEFSHLVIAAARATEANAELILEGIRGKTTREVQAFMSRVTNDGRIMDRAATYELTLVINEEQQALLDRARDILSHSGHVPSAVEILSEALEALLDKRDPVRRAKRAENRKEKAKAKTEAQKEKVPTDSAWNPLSDVQEEQLEKTTNPAQDSPRNRWQAEPIVPHRIRQPIPQAIKRSVWLRDQSQCTYLYPDGSRCPCTMMLEIDHKTMVCRGGDNSLNNLRLLCRAHNAFEASVTLKRPFPSMRRSG